MTREAETWLPARQRLEASYTGRLIVLPHAGCGALQWFQWAEGMPPWVEVRVVRLPGRESRLQEPPLTSPSAVIEALAAAFEALPPLPTILFGHSLGAHLAYALCHRLPGRIRAFVASGSAPPGRRSPRRPLSTLPDLELAQAAHRLWQSIPDEILTHPELQALFLPALRGDLALAEGWPDDPHPPLHHSLVAVAGDQDPECSPTDLDDWCARTLGPASQIRHPGGHMAVLEDPGVRRRLTAACVELLLS